MDTFQLITIKSSDPFIRGLQYGQQAEALIHLGIEGYQRHFSKTLDLTWKDITEKSRLYLDLLEREFPEELEEARGIAEGSSVPLEDILVLNCRYEILKYRPHECTTGAILPVVSADRCSTFLIQNWDYRPWVEHHAVVVSIDDEKGTHIVGVTVRQQPDLRVRHRRRGGPGHLRPAQGPQQPLLLPAVQHRPQQQAGRVL